MHNYIRVVLLVFLLVVALSVQSEAVTRVARSFNVIDFYAGSGSGMGTYNGLPGVSFNLDGRLIDVDAADVYGTPLFLSLGYGQVQGGHFMLSVRFQFASHDLKDSFPISPSVLLIPPPGVKLRQYDLTLDLDYQLNDLHESVWAPFGGVGLQAGFTTKSLKGYQSENQLSLALSLNLGAEVKLYTSPSKRSFVTLASVNSWDFLATGDRPRYLNFGGALKYYFRH